tara:strand:- start:2122 stop:2532 length:411 start_codon:yes stop_codon:yes gene_type:complete
MGEHLLCKQGVTGSIPVYSTNGRLAEWLNALVLKTSIPSSVSKVRILHLPPPLNIRKLTVKKSENYNDLTFVDYKLYKNGDVLSFDEEISLDKLQWDIGDTLQVFRDHKGRIALRPSQVQEVFDYSYEMHKEVCDL